MEKLPMQTLDTLITSQGIDFKANVLETVRNLIMTSAKETDEQGEYLLPEFVIYSGYDPQKLIFRRAGLVGKVPFYYTETLFIETLAEQPRYLALSIDGYKQEAGQANVNSYLVCFFFPDLPLEVYEIEHGGEEGGWASEGARLSGGTSMMSGRAEAYAKLFHVLMQNV